MNRKEETEYIKHIPELEVASYLYLRGFKIHGKYSDGSRVVLEFIDKNHQIDKEILNYRNGAKVEAKAYSDSFRHIKNYAFQD